MIKPPAMEFEAMAKPKFQSRWEEYSKRGLYKRNGGLRVKHRSYAFGCKSVYQPVSWEVVGLSLRDVREGAI